MSSNKQECGPKFGAPKSCPVLVGDTICGETNSLEIMKEFNRMYEEKMERMDTQAGGECLGEKIKLQQDWIRNLTQQNEMLVKAVQELEFEATERVHQLEEKLHKSAQCLCEVMKKYREHDFVADLLAEPLQKIAHLEHDLATVLEFIKRVRESKTWTIDGLFFYNVSKQQLLGCLKKSTFEDSNEGEKMLLEKDKKVSELSDKIKSYDGNMGNLSLELDMRKKECYSLKQELADVRQALTEEVATQHDQAVVLKKEVQQLEERCVQADKQIQFKEDIIKELRKEIKQLQQQFTNEEISKMNVTIGELRSTLEKTKIVQEEEEQAHQDEIESLNNTVVSLQQQIQISKENHEKDLKICKICRGKSKVGFLESSEIQVNLDNNDSGLVKIINDTKTKMTSEIDKRNREIELLKTKISELTEALCTCEERAANLQEAVALYSNSISVLEQSRNEAKCQIDNQKVTIGNLQRALVDAKTDIDSLRKKNEEHVSSWSAWFGFNSNNDVALNNNDMPVHDV